MDSLACTWDGALSYDAMVEAATKNAELYRVTRAHAVAPRHFVERVVATGRRWRLLSVSEDWCGDSVNTLPWVDALATAAPNLEHRVIRRDEHPDLMDRHLTNGRARAIPIVLLLDEHLVERAWWGPRPRALQEWFESPEAQALSKEERYKVLRTRYARDRGTSILEAITGMIERAAAQPGADEADDAIDSATTHAGA